MVQIEQLKYGEIRIDGRDYYNDVIVFWDGEVIQKPKSHWFALDDFLQVNRKGIEVLVIGRGLAGSITVHEKAKEMAYQGRIQLYVERSQRAMELFNLYIRDGRKAVAVIHTSL